MPLFYFHLHNDVDVPDEEGQEFPNLRTAVAHAAGEARALAAELIKEEGRIVLDHSIDVEDERGSILATVRLGDVVTVEQRR